MNALVSLLLLYIVNSLWQVPLILVGALLAARVMRPAGAAAEHRVWVTALVLEGALPAVSLLPWEQMHLAWLFHAHAATLADGNVAVEMGAGTAFAALRLPPRIAAVLMIVYLAVTAYCVMRFAWRCVRLSRMRSTADPVVKGSEAELAWERSKLRFDAGHVVLACSTEVFSPVTMGIMAKRVLLPAGLVSRLTQSDLDTAIAHELAHIRRNDFLKNLLYEMVSLSVSYHPGVWLARQRVMETREMICDEMAAEDAGNHAYAESLLRLASLLLGRNPVRVPHAIGIFDSNTLERRLMKLTEEKKTVGRARRVALAGLSVMLGLATAVSALALRIGVDDANHQATQKKALTVPPERMQTMILKKVNPVYPTEAKKARIQGSVQLHAVIGKTGQVENLKVESGPNQLQQSAMDAVRQWVYKPFLLNGEPVEVETTITVVYSLRK